MLNVVLVEPEIPQNTGNIARTCAATGSSLHLVEPLGFRIDDRYLKRAGLDYWHLLELHRYPDLDDFMTTCGERPLYLATTKGGRAYTEVEYPESCFVMFGKESRGLPEWLLNRFSDRTVRIPIKDQARSLNLSNAVAILVYEVLRQHGFPDLVRTW